MARIAKRSLMAGLMGSKAQWFCRCGLSENNFCAQSQRHEASGDFLGVRARPS